MKKKQYYLIIFALIAWGCTSSNYVFFKLRSYDKKLTVYDKLEVDFDISASYSNPYDFNEIEINGVFWKENSDTMVIPTFWFEQYKIDEANKKIESKNDGFWKLRFTPMSSGKWNFYISAMDSSGLYEKSPVYTFVADSSKNDVKGFIKPDTANKQYFVYDNSKELFFGFGLNSDVNVFNKSEAADTNNGNWGKGSGYLPPWTGSPSQGLTPENLYKGYSYHKHIVISLGENGGKAIRINTDRYYQPIEAKAELKPYDSDITFDSMGFDLGRYNQAMCFILDEIYSKSEDFNIGIVHNVWDAIADQPYSAGFCYAERNNEDLIKRKLRYINARWGYSTSYWMTEYFNEYKNVKIDSFWSSIISWNRKIDPYDHPISLTSATFGESGPDVYLENAYTNKCYKFRVNPQDDMPGCLGEFGEHYILATKDPHTYDTAGHWVRQTFWNALVSKWAGGFTWWTHPIYGEKGCNAYDKIYPAFAKFIENENMPAEGLWDTLQVDGNNNEFDHIRALVNEERSKAYVWILRTPPNIIIDREPLLNKTIELTLNEKYTYKAEWWNTQSGNVFKTIDKIKLHEGKLSLPVENITRDAFVKIHKNE